MNKLFFPLVALAFAGCSGGQVAADYKVVPLPQTIEASQEAPFVISKKTVVGFPAGDELLRRNAEFLSDYVSHSTGYALEVQADAEGGDAIVLALNPEVKGDEAYRITVSAGLVRVEGATARGVFYGIQTLRKSIPAVAPGAQVKLPAGSIAGSPRFGYRGMHLDVCRHFFPADFVKKYIDLLALHNMNTLHFHLTDDQGWRVEIKRYPELTEVGSVRHRTVVGYCGSGKYDSVTVQGFYTQDELRDLVEYAAERYVNIIPEVDLPGHMLAALASYPELGCTGGPYEVCPDWGVFPDVLCVGNEKTFGFIEGVLTELIDIFPSKYIHIGGDEIPRDRWEVCPKCQARIKAEGLKADKDFSAEDRLQSYCMARVERFLNAKGRNIIGWDEILDGDVAPNATVMSWRGSAGGIKAAQMGHQVIMAPNTHCYFDYYQTADTENEPLSIGGFIPLEKVYSLEPTAGLTPEQAKYIWGVQANLWVEYIHTTEHIEYMVLPRMAALAEVQWCRPEEKDYAAFTKRVMRLMELYHRDGLNYAKHLYEVSAVFAPDTLNHRQMLTLSTVDDAPIHYTTDGTDPTEVSQLYTAPIALDATTEVRVAAFRPVGGSRILGRSVGFNKATLRPIALTATQPAPNYTFEGARTLADGRRGQENFSTGTWLGFLGDVTAVIDLEQEQPVSSVEVTAMTYMDAWIMGPSALKVEVSTDGKNFTTVGEQQIPADTDVKKREIVAYTSQFHQTPARYVRLTVARSKALPKGHVGEGQLPYLFLDEIVVE